MYSSSNSWHCHLSMELPCVPKECVRLLSMHCSQRKIYPSLIVCWIYTPEHSGDITICNTSMHDILKHEVFSQIFFPQCHKNLKSYLSSNIIFLILETHYSLSKSVPKWSIRWYNKNINKSFKISSYTHDFARKREKAILHISVLPQVV